MTHATQRRRNKKYRPKPITAPIMQELQEEFAFAGHGALAALRLAPNVDALDQLAAIFNAIAVALADKRRTSVILDSGMRALQEVVDRFERCGALAIGRYELPPIENAVHECEQLLKQLDVHGLYLAHLKTRALARMARLSTPAEAIA